MREKNKKIVIKIQAFILMLGIVNMLFCTLESGVEAALYKSKGDFIPKSEVKYVEGDNEFTYFPESYRENLKALKAKHPNWIFMAVYNNLDWYDSISHESYEKGSSEYISTVPASYSEVWKKDGKNYSVNGDSRWVIASKAGVGYCLDPRNFLNENYIFQFEVLEWTNLSKTDVDTAVKYLLPNMYNTKTYVNTSGQTVNMDKSYVDIIYDAAKENNVNPISIITKIKQEVGDFKSDGSKNASVSGTVNGYVGYYNFFNVNATDGVNAIVKGLSYAKSKGWDTPEKSIKAGASTLYNSYIKYGQNTLYNQKYDVTNIYDNAIYLYAFQYMTNILDPGTQAQNIYASYKKMGIENSNFVFYIPVYNNMPSTASQLDSNTEVTYTEESGTLKVVNCSSLNLRSGPSSSSNLLGSLKEGTILTKLGVYNNGWVKVKTEDGTIGCVSAEYVEKTEIKKVDVTGISINKTSFEIEVGDRLEYSVNITPSDASNKNYKIETSDANVISINGKDVVGKKEGKATLTFTSEEGNFKVTAEVNVKPQTKRYEIDTSKLTIDGDKIRKIGFNTKFEYIKSCVKLYNNSSILAKDINGRELSDSNILGTGTVISINDSNGNNLLRYTVVVKGDVNGDGKATAADYVKIKNHIMGTDNVSDTQKLGADANGDGKVSAADYVVIKNHIMGTSTITN